VAFVDLEGLAVSPGRPVVVSDAEILRSQDITIIRLRRRRFPWRAIGKYLRMSHEGARKRYQHIPPEVREQYSRLAALG
jgi:hypothetical protein